MRSTGPKIGMTAAMTPQGSENMPATKTEVEGDNEMNIPPSMHSAAAALVSTATAVLWRAEIDGASRV